MAYYVADVRLLLWADNEAEACDVVSETMRDTLEEFSPGSAMIDWVYVDPATSPRLGTSEEFEYEKK